MAITEAKTNRGGRRQLIAGPEIDAVLVTVLRVGRLRVSVPRQTIGEPQVKIEPGSEQKAVIEAKIVDVIFALPVKLLGCAGQFAIDTDLLFVVHDEGIADRHIPPRAEGVLEGGIDIDRRIVRLHGTGEIIGVTRAHARAKE